METRTPNSLPEAWGPGSHAEWRLDSKGNHAQWSRRVSGAFLSAFNIENFTWEIIYHLKPDSQAWSKKAKEWLRKPMLALERQWATTTRDSKWGRGESLPPCTQQPASVTLRGLLPWTWRGWIDVWLLGPLSVSVSTDYNDDFCLFCFFVLVWLFFLYFFSSLQQSCFPLTLLFKKILYLPKKTQKKSQRKLK